MMDRSIFIPSSGRTSIGGFLVAVAWRRGDARINFAYTADNCGQMVWTDADCPQYMQKNAEKLGKNAEKLQTCGNEKTLT